MSRHTRQPEVAICKICSQSADPFAETQLLEKYTVQYFQCRNCGFTQTETPYWLEEAYSEAITNTDIGLVGRNIALSKISKVLIFAFFDCNAQFMDYGGGYGLFARLMRDLGFDFYRSDRSCPNLLAKRFEAETEGKQQYELVTAFEVFEHLVDPLDEIEQILRFSKNILFSTSLIPPHNPRPDEWWYYGLEHGQHVSFYTRESLLSIAKYFGLNFFTNGKSLHLLTERNISPMLFRFILRGRVTRLLDLLFKRDSLLAKDYYQITGRKLE